MIAVHGACDRLVRWWIDSMVFQTLMIPMAMIVVDVFFNGPAKRAFPKEEHLTQALGFDAAEKAFDERVAIWTFGWQSNRFCTGRVDVLSEL